MPVTYGRFAASTGGGTQTVATGVGEAIKGLIVFGVKLTAEGYGSGYAFSIGAADAAGNDWHLAVGSDDGAATSNTYSYGGIDGLGRHLTAEATYDCVFSVGTFESDGDFTITWDDAPSSAWEFHYLAFWGGDVHNCAALTVDNSTASGAQAITGVGFRGSWGFSTVAVQTAGSNATVRLTMGQFASSTQRGMIGLVDADAAADASVGIGQRTDRMNGFASTSGTWSNLADFVSWDPDGFTITWDAANGSARPMHFFIADIDGAQVQALTADTGGAAQFIGGPFGVASGFLAFSRDQPAASTIDNSSADAAKISLFAGDAVGSGGIWISEDEGAATMEANMRTRHGVGMAFSDWPSTTDGEATIAPATNRGLDVTWTDAPTRASEVIVSVFGGVVAPSARPIGNAPMRSTWLRGTSQFVKHTPGDAGPAVSQDWTFEAASGALTAVLGQVTTTDVAQAIGRLKAKALGQASATDTAQVLSRAKARSLGQASDAAAAQTLTRQKSRALGQPSDTSSAQPITAPSALTAIIGQASTTETALAIARLKTRLLGQVTETATAQAIARAKRRALGQVSGTETAQALARRKTRALGLVSATDAAQALTRRKTRALGQVVETALAQAIGRRKAKALGQATTTESAQALTRRRTRSLGQALETATALALGRRKLRELGQASTTDSAQPIATSAATLIGQVSTSDVAQVLGRRKTRALGQTADASTALPLLRIKIRPVGQASTTDAAEPILVLRRLTIGQALEADAALGLQRLKRGTLGQVATTDTALEITRAGLVTPASIVGSTRPRVAVVGGASVAILATGSVDSATSAAGLSRGRASVSGSSRPTVEVG